MVTGLLTIDRKILETDEYDVAQNAINAAPVVGLKDHPNVTRAPPLIPGKRLTVAPAWQIITSACNHCGGRVRDVQLHQVHRQRCLGRCGRSLFSDSLDRPQRA
jgi:hypothetical protein